MMILLFAVISSVLLGRVRSGPLFWFVAFPGVVLHELSHYVIAIVLRGKPEPMNLVPQKQPTGEWVFGSVIFYPSWWNAGFVALAPMYVLPAVGWALYSNLQDDALMDIVFGGYLLACIAWGSKPSSADWKIALSRPIGTIALLLSLGGLMQAVWPDILASLGI